MLLALILLKQKWLTKTVKRYANMNIVNKASYPLTNVIIFYDSLPHSVNPCIFKLLTYKSKIML